MISVLTNFVNYKKILTSASSKFKPKHKANFYIKATLQFNNQVTKLWFDIVMEDGTENGGGRIEFGFD